MKSYSFDVAAGPIIVLADVWGRIGIDTLSLILDTGADLTTINPVLLRELGLRESAARIRLLTGSRFEIAPTVVVPKMKALGKTRTQFEVAAFSLPGETKIDGILGLDFLRGFELNINFRSGRITLK